ncbi:hypothetical protein FRC07_002859, partial [Ceratobasidium sp. 392]
KTTSGAAKPAQAITPAGVIGAVPAAAADLIPPIVADAAATVLDGATKLVGLGRAAAQDNVNPLAIVGAVPAAIADAIPPIVPDTAASVLNGITSIVGLRRATPADAITPAGVIGIVPAAIADAIPPIVPDAAATVLDGITKLIPIPIKKRALAGPEEFAAQDAQDANIEERLIADLKNGKAAGGKRMINSRVAGSLSGQSIDLSLRPELIETQLARSKNASLDVWLESGDFKTAGFQESLRMLEQKDGWARIRDLHVELDFKRTSLLVDALNSSIDANPFGIFESIVLRTPGRHDESNKLSLHMPQSPALRWIQLSCVDLSPIPCPPLSTLPRLDYLELDDVSVELLDLLLPLLSLATNLEYLSLTDCQLLVPERNVTTSRPKHSILLAKLTALNLCFIEGADGLNVLFQTLSMPNLQELHFNADSDGFGGVLDWDAICHSGHAIDELCLIGFVSRDLMGLLPHINGFDRLVRTMVEGPHITSEFAERFARKLLEPTSCPALEELLVYIPFAPSGDECLKTIEELGRMRPSLAIRTLKHGS